MKKLILGILITMTVGLPLFAQEDLFGDDPFGDVGSLFSDDDFMVDSEQITKESIAEEQDKESVTFSGQILNRTSYYMARDWLNGTTNSDLNRFDSSMEGNLLLDFRLKKGIKAFVNIDFGYYPTGNATYKNLSTMLEMLTLESLFGSNFAMLLGMGATNTNAGLDDLTDQLLGSLGDSITMELKFAEIFLDFNIKNKVYFRIGKQVLQWGRNYFWNPTDLVNVERKDFMDLDDYRTGSYGLKMHIPFGTAVNIYTFIDGNDAEKLEDLGFSGKFEFLIGGTEMAFSGFAKKGLLPVWGFDISSRIGSVDIRGEISLSYGENREHAEKVDETNYVTVQTVDEWIPRVSVGFSKSFDFMDVSDRITLVGEFYYNHSGYSENTFADTNYTMYIVQNGLYRPYDHNQFYLSLFTTISKFIDPDLTFSLNALANLNDGSVLLSTGLSYNPIHNFYANMNLFALIGPEKAEFTFAGQQLGLELLTQLKF